MIQGLPTGGTGGVEAQASRINANRESPAEYGEAGSMRLEVCCREQKTPALKDWLNITFLKSNMMEYGKFCFNHNRLDK
jgi:hypothetical protein